jgi:hypothetical protein
MFKGHFYTLPKVFLAIVSYISKKEKQHTSVSALAFDLFMSESIEQSP